MIVRELMTGGQQTAEATAPGRGEGPHRATAHRRVRIRSLHVLAVVFALAAVATVLAQTPAQSAPPNAALRYWMAFAQMQNPPAGDLAAELARVESGAVSFDEARHGAVLDGNAAALITMRRASRLATCDWGVDLELGPYAPVAHVARGLALARLNTMAGIREAAAGNADIALEQWVATIRFSQHLASGGSLLATLAASTALRSALGAIERTLVSGALAGTAPQDARAALRAIPETGFAWDDAWQMELQAIEGWVAQLAVDPQAFEQVTGRSAAARPGQSDIAGYRRFMTRAAAALALPPDAAQPVLTALEQERATLHEFIDGLIPSLLRVNDTRTQLKAERDRVLRLLEG